jgi:hypothetical protein
VPDLKQGIPTMSEAFTKAITSIPVLGSAIQGRVSPRRAFLAGGVASTASAALMVSVVGMAGASSVSADAELIALCADFDALERKIDALFEGVSALEFDAADAAACVIEVDQRRVLDRICALTPSTDEGCKAVARALALLAPDYGLPSVYVTATMDERLANLLARGMMGRAAA